MANHVGPGSTSGSRVLVAIPAWNEEHTIAQVIQDTQNIGSVEQILVVDDGSHDLTGNIAQEQGAIVLTLPFNIGVGGAMRTAFLYAKQHDFDFVVQVDADGQHDPQDVETLVAAADDANVVIGARFASDDDYDVSLARRLAMKILAFSMSKVTHTKLTDATSGFRVSDRRAIDVFAHSYPAEYLGDTVESLVIAANAGLTVTQVPVQMRQRQGGQASQSRLMASLYLGRAMLALFVSLTRLHKDESEPEELPASQTAGDQT